MQVYSGKSVFRGIAIGKISVYRKNEQQVKRVRTEDTKGELARYDYFQNDHFFCVFCQRF